MVRESEVGKFALDCPYLRRVIELYPARLCHVQALLYLQILFISAAYNIQGVQIVT